MTDWQTIVAAAEAAGPWTPRERLEEIRDLAESVDILPGVFCEFGVANGSSALALAWVAARHGRKLLLFDNFSGLPAPSQRDKQLLGTVGANQLTGKCHGSREKVVELLRQHVPECDYRIVKGDICDTVSQVTDPVAFAHIDCDRFPCVKASAAHVLRHMPGGAVLLANGFWKTTRVAVAESIEEWWSGKFERYMQPVRQPETVEGVRKTFWFRMPPHGHTSVAGAHLGGYKPATEQNPHGNPKSYETGIWQWFIDEFGARSMLDIGCAEGHGVKWWLDRGMEATGIEGCPEAVIWSPCRARITCRDFAESTAILEYWDGFDLVWSTECFEHLTEAAIANMLQAVATERCKWLAFTASQDKRGHHHVSVHPSEWWIDRVKPYGFQFSPELTEQARARSVGYFAETGMVFTHEHSPRS